MKLDSKNLWWIPAAIAGISVAIGVIWLVVVRRRAQRLEAEIAVLNERIESHSEEVRLSELRDRAETIDRDVQDLLDKRDRLADKRYLLGEDYKERREKVMAAISWDDLDL